MVIPADPQEMLQFQEQCVAQCQCAVDISFPLAYILLPSKQAFQSIYNRFHSTAFIWDSNIPFVVLTLKSLTPNLFSSYFISKQTNFLVRMFRFSKSTNIFFYFYFT